MCSTWNITELGPTSGRCAPHSEGRVNLSHEAAQPSKPPTPSVDAAPGADLAGIERSLDRLTAELGEVSCDQRQRERLITLGTVAGLIAHELNNLLTPAIGYGRAALRRPEDDAFGRKALQRCVEAAERAGLVAASVLELASIESDRVDGSGANVLGVVEREIGAHGVSADGVPITVDIPADLTVAMRPERLERVLQNLIANARRAMLGRTGSVRLVACSTGNTAQIAVEDDGPGLPTGTGAAVFNAFVSGSRSSGGTGLGLTLCRELVRDAGGGISAERAASGGARFVVELPLAIAADQDSSAA